MSQSYPHAARSRVSQSGTEMTLVAPLETGHEDAGMLWQTFSPALAGAPRMRLAVKRAHGRVEYPSTHERPLSADVPSVPAAIRVYGNDGRCQALCLDFDAKGEHSPAAAAADERHLTRLLGVLGLRWVSDLSPNGGRHVYVPLETPLPFLDAREIVEGLAARFPTLDAGPHQSALTGCIRPPGSLHASGGFQALTQPLSVAVDAIERPNSPDEIDELRAAIAGDIEQARLRRSEADTQPLDVDVTRIGPLTPVSPRLVAIARHGQWDADRYGSDRSAARQAVITGCVAAGWTYADVYRRLADGTWPGLAAMYAKYATPGARSKALRADIESARRYLALSKQAVSRRDDGVRKSNTSATLSRRGVADYDEHAYIRTWRAVLGTFEKTRLPGRRFYSARFLLRALGEAAHKTGSRQVAFGCRSLAEATGMDYSTVSVLLRELAAHGWIKKVARGWGERADVWELTIPTELAELVTEVTWPKGKIHALRPAFRALGHVSALVFEAVETYKANCVTSLSRHLSMARSSVHEAVDMLMSWRLLERDDSKQLRAFPERLDYVAEYLGVDEEVYAQMMKHRKQRALWRAWLARFESDEYVEILSESDGWGLSPAGNEIEAA